jgi:hypothetical protein
VTEQPLEPNAFLEIFASILATCMKKGFVEPLYMAAVSSNGSTRVIRYASNGGDHLFSQILAENFGAGSFVPPINIMITDARGHATRICVAADGMVEFSEKIRG